MKEEEDRSVLKVSIKEENCEKIIQQLLKPDSAIVG